MTSVVFLHGRGQGPETVEAVRPGFPDADLVAPRGGVKLRHGRTWFENVRTGVAVEDSVLAAERLVLRWLDARPRLGRPVLCGFSNGGALAGHLLIRHPARFAGAALLAAPLVLPPWPDGALKGVPVLYARGDATDTVVDAAFYDEAEAYLAGVSGAKATLRRYASGHEIAPEMVADCRRWFQSLDQGVERTDANSPPADGETS